MFLKSSNEWHNHCIYYRRRFKRLSSRNSDGHLKDTPDSGRAGEQGGRSMATSSILNKVGTFILAKREIDRRVFGEKVGLIGKIFGCWHEEMSRPFSDENIAYRSCIKCGARKQFDSGTLQTHGSFYFPPVVKANNLF